MRRIIAFLLLVASISLNAQTYNILDYQAKGDGQTLNTVAIQKALDDCSKNGGGTVLIPAGQFLTGTLQVFSNIDLHLEAGAVLLGSPKIADYDTKHPHLIWGNDLSNFSISGTGTINGNGEAFFDTRAYQEGFSWKAKERPEPWIHFSQCSRLRVTDVQFLNSPAHVLVFQDAQNILVDGITIENDLRSPNTDGIDLKTCKDVRISNCSIRTGDDAICLKASRGDVENVVVSNCVLVSDDSAIKFGTGSAYRIRNCQFSNINISDTRYGIALFMLMGGVYEQCIFDNIIIDTKSKHLTQYPIYIDIDRRTAKYDLGKIRDMIFRDILIHTGGNVLVGGQPESMIERLHFENVKLKLKKLNDLTKVKSKPRGNRKYPKLPGTADFSNIPSHFSFGNIDGLHLEAVNTYVGEEANNLKRHNFYFFNAKNVEILNVGTKNTIELLGVKQEKSSINLDAN